MNRNIEIKARIRDLDRMKTLAELIADSECQVLIQEDIFFHCRSGRLKLRVFADGQGELIYYERPDAVGPKQSSYIISPTSEPDALRQSLASALGILGIVRKTRLLYMVGQTRVHLDAVEGLGTFLELEVVLEPRQTAEEGQAIADELANRLGIKEGDLISGAYIDLPAA